VQTKDRWELPPIGDRMRKRRRELGISLDALAEQTGLSKGFLSQVERSQCSPSIDSLGHIATALGVPMFLFFVDDSRPRVVVRKEERREIGVPDSRFRFETIWFTPDRKMEILIGRLEPGLSNVDEPSSHASTGMESVDECVLVLRGRLRLEVSGEVYDLDEGDSAYFNGNLPHCYTAVGDEELSVLIALTPPAMSR
jgi:transcriptional regulator with XRE-family HTH domain